MKHTTSSYRRAATSKGLIIALGVVALGAAIFWAMRMRGEDTGVVEQAEYTMYCTECKQIKVPTEVLKTLPTEAGKWKCIKCQKFTASFEPPLADPRMQVP